jgi:hypothetical protein
MKQSFLGASRRTVLLVEIERYCEQSDCLRLNRIGLTRAEINDYKGFNCERCEAWNEDALALEDVPADWLENLNVNGENTA